MSTTRTTDVQPPRTLVVVESVHHGNTKKVADVLGEVFQADVVTAESVNAAALVTYDCVAFGSGIYFGRHHRAIRDLINSLDSRCQKAIVFSTAGLPFLSAAFHWPVRRALKNRGRQTIGEFCCRGWDTVGPLSLLGGINRKHPNDRDLDRTRKFAQQMRALLHESEAQATQVVSKPRPVTAKVSSSQGVSG